MRSKPLAYVCVLDCTSFANMLHVAVFNNAKHIKLSSHLSSHVKDGRELGVTHHRLWVAQGTLVNFHNEQMYILQKYHLCSLLHPSCCTPKGWGTGQAQTLELNPGQSWDWPHRY